MYKHVWNQKPSQQRHTDTQRTRAWATHRVRERRKARGDVVRNRVWDSEIVWATFTWLRLLARCSKRLACHLVWPPCLLPACPPPLPARFGIKFALTQIVAYSYIETRTLPRPDSYLALLFPLPLSPSFSLRVYLKRHRTKTTYKLNCWQAERHEMKWNFKKMSLIWSQCVQGAGNNTHTRTFTHTHTHTSLR